MRVRRSLILVIALGVLMAACSSGSSDGDDANTEETTEPADVAEPTDTGESLVIQDGDVVEVHYVGTLDDGSEFDSSRTRGATFSFTVGTGEVIVGFDRAVRGAKVGDVNTERMESTEAYGEWTEEAVVVVPFNPDQDDVKAGDEVFLTNGQSAIILEVTPEEVKLDANHALAGEALTFEVEIISITRG